MTDSDDAVDPAEFETWLSPSHALALLQQHMSWELATRALILRLSAGQIQAAAQVLVIDGASDEGEYHLKRMTKLHWSGGTAGGHFSPLWQTGDFQRVHFVKGVGAHYGASTKISVTFVGIRFEPSGVRQMLPREVPFANPRDADRDVPAARPPVAQADLSRWHEVFKTVYPNAAEALALRSAAAMFPENEVSRQRVRELRGPQPIGKPRSRGE